MRHILAVDFIGLTNPPVDLKDFVNLHILRLKVPISYNGSHVEFTLALSTMRELISLLLDCGLSSEAV